MTILSVSASEYLGRTETGRSHPMKCMCECEDGSEKEVYVKYKDFHEDLVFDHLVGELVANQFALDLGLPAATPCLVCVDQDFLAALPRDEEGDALRAAFDAIGGIAFGSVAFSANRRWAPTNIVHRGQLRQATQLYLFDTIVENSDRGVGNTNLLALGHDFKVIDFGHSFQRCHGGSDYNAGAFPWQHGGIFNHFPGNMQHVLLSGLKDVTEEMIDDFTTNLSGLSDNVIEDYVTIVPPAWGDECACKIVDYLLDARDNADGFSTRAKEVLL
ncbi:HipA family kinase [Paracoccus cavernae]|uniref:HipA family kinase n=1 Tax=Paracoccus cavernae TaxID=1571207 RepID=UPI0035F28F75